MICHVFEGVYGVFFFLLIFGHNILRYQAFRITKNDRYLPTLATIEQEKMKNCSVLFLVLSSGLFDLQFLPEHRASHDMRSLYLLYYFIVGKCFGIRDVRVA